MSEVKVLDGEDLKRYQNNQAILHWRLLGLARVEELRMMGLLEAATTIEKLLSLIVVLPGN